MKKHVVAVLGTVALGMSTLMAGEMVTVADLFAKGASLKGKEVTIKGKITKVSEAIMGKNWVHVQDGTGDATKKTNDILVTTQELPKVGTEVHATGIVATDVDLGYGYKYQVLVEKASFK